MKIVVFTDLDGSLLDFDHYSFEGARLSLERLKRHHIPVVFTTSKTRREVEVLRQEMGIDAPSLWRMGRCLYSLSLHDGLS
jgi:mannosyl-3-phosphoglycerate phosphatase